tara:strand:+ start:2295 stop:3218 length:924 start_codon:yes stop_codon:yes gene_type:complete
MLGDTMAYDNTGKGHRTAIEDEARFSDWLNSGGHKKFDWGGARFIVAKTVGGTQHTEDVVVETSDEKVNFSCKLARSGIDHHSHTYKNTSKLISKLKNEKHPCIQPILDLEAYRDQEVNRISDPNIRRSNRDQYAQMMRSACSQTLLNLPSEVISELFEISMKHALAMDYMVIYDQPAGCYYWWKPEDHPAIAALNDSWDIQLIQKTEGSESANLLLLGPNGEIEDLKLRLRVKHNNGVSDLFRMGTQNSGSFVTTIQQDPGSVRSILEIMDKQGKLGKANHSEQSKFGQMLGLFSTILVKIITYIQ